MILVDVVIPLIDYSSLIEESLNSCLAHKSKIVVYLKVKSLKAEYGPLLEKYRSLGLNIELIVQNDQGIYSALNQALNCTQGSHVLVIGAGDTLTNDFSKVFRKLTQETGLIAPVLLTDSNGTQTIYRGRLTPSHQGIIYPAFIFENIRYDERYKIISDRILYDQVLENNSCGFFTVAYPICCFNLVGISSSLRGRRIILLESLVYFFRSPGRKNLLRLFSSSANLLFLLISQSR